MAVKKVYLDFEIHLNDAARVAELQANPPGETSVQNGKKYIIRAPEAAAVEFKDEPTGDGTPLPYSTYFGMPPFTIVPPNPPTPGTTTGTKPPTGIRSFIYSAWFTATNPDWSKNFPTNVSTFTRKSGGWFGITALFGTTTRFYWRGLFVYDAPPTADGIPGGAVNGNLSERIWIDPIFTNGAAAPSSPSASVKEYELTRDASAWPDGFGIGMRGADTGVRLHNPTDYYGGTAQNINLVWERLYVKWRKAGGTGIKFWAIYNTAGANIRVELAITPTGQISVTGYDGGGTPTLLGTTSALPLNVKTKIDLVSRFAVDIGAGVPGGGTLFIFVNGVQIMAAGFAVGVGLNVIGFHAKSEICTATVGFDGEFDISFWMAARLPATIAGGIKQPIYSGLDFLNGSRAVPIRPVGDSATRANWVGDWRTLAAPFPRSLNTGDALTSTTANARLAVKTDALRGVGSLPGAMGMVAMCVTTHGWRGTLNGQLGYKLNGAGDVLKNLAAPDSINNEGGSNNARSWGSIMQSLVATPTLLTITDLELLRIKGNDAVSSGTDHLSAVAEVIGTFADCDYPPNLDPTLRNPLPDLGHHNAPYPRTPWAIALAPPISPVTITAGDYSGNGTFQDLFFRNPVHWIWILKKTNVGFSPTGVRWFSTMLGATKGQQKSPWPWFMPVQEIDPQFTAVATNNPPTGAGAVPDRSAQVAAIVAIPNNASLLDGNESHKRDLLGIIIRTLNADNPGDGNNWGFLKKTDQGDFIPADIIVWNPSREHFDVLTDTAATWIADGVMSNPAWIWLQAGDEGQQEQQTVIRLAGADEEINKVGEDYAYVAVSDPGMRFMLNGAMTHSDPVCPIAHSLIHPLFLGKAAFYHETRPGTDGNGEMGFKGPGHAVSETTKLNTPGTTQSNALTMNTSGVLTLGTGLAFGTDTHLAYNLWRMDDGSGDPNVARVVQIGSYVGNGAGGTRDIAFPVPCGKRPLWAIVVPHASEAYLKTHGMTGGNSSRMGGLHITTAITGGGLDKITVGVTLNVNLTVYEFFIIVGGDTAGNDGFSPPGVYEPVDPTTPQPGGPYGPDPEDPTLPTVPPGEPGGDPPGAPGTGPDDIDTDLAAECVPFTKRIFNDALSRIGISKRISNAATDINEEANLCRQHYARAIEQTLRDFPWPFATRYANLVLITGSVASPANRDWTYSYRRPTDCVFERRLAVLREGAVDPTPPPFNLSYDDTLAVGRILTNQAGAQLEYTARPLCTAGRGDPLFLDALTWRLASRIAGPLTRVADVMKVCLDQYDAKIARAYEVLRPGNPGPRTDIDANLLDTALGAAAANVSVINRALIRIGAKTISNLGTEQCREAEAARVLFEEELRSTLRDYPWSFATRYDSGLVLLVGTATVPVNDDWQYSYRVTADAVKVRRIVGANRRHPDPDPRMFRLASDFTGTLMFTDQTDPTIEYTSRVDNCVLRSDALFRDALAWRLAACLAPSLATVDPGETEQLGRGPQDRPRERKSTEAQLRDRAATSAWRQYYLAIEKARIADAGEQQQDPNTGDAPWITGRN